MYIKGICVCVCGRGMDKTSSLILSSTVYSDIKFILEREDFQIITQKMTILFFFQCRHPHLADPPPPVHSCLFLADPPPP